MSEERETPVRLDWDMFDGMVPHQEGDYVRFEDYQRLERRLAEAGEWRSVEDYDAAAADHQSVLVWDGRRHFTARYYPEDGRFHCDECMDTHATHWMPLPDPPVDAD